MIIPDKKKMATMIVADLKKPDQMPEEGGESSAYEAIASDILSAIDAGDAKGLAEALRAFHMECESGEYEE